MPTSDTCVPKVLLIVRRSFISSTHGTHHVAHTFMTRTGALAEKESAIFSGSLSSTRFAAPAAVATLRQKAANGTNARIGSVHLHFQCSVLLVGLHALCVVRD